MKRISFLLLVFSISWVVFVIIGNRKRIFHRFDPQAMEQKYKNSQWVVPNSKKGISDGDLYAYAGYLYLHGKNPILINPELPPLGKYILGLSIELFGDPAVLNILISIISLFLIFELIFLTTRSYLFASLGIFLTVINSVYIDQILNPTLLDIQHLFFFLLFLIIFLLYLKKEKYWLMVGSGFILGMFLSIKPFVIFFPLVTVWLFIFFAFVKKTEGGYENRIREVLNFVVLEFSSLFAFVATYFQYFLKGGNLRGLMGVQKWIFTFYSSSKIDRVKIMGKYLDLIFFNKWHFWSKGYPIIHLSQWSLIWPLEFLIGIVSSAYVLRLFKDRQIKFSNILDSGMILLSLFFVIYNLFLFIVPVFSRYFLLLFVSSNILSSLLLYKFFQLNK